MSVTVTRLPDVQCNLGFEKTTVTTTYQVITTDKDQGPLSIALTPGIPHLGAFYSYGAETNPLLKLVSIQPKRIGNTRLVWNVDCTFESPSADSGGGGTDNNGNKDKDPRNWHDEIDISYNTRTIPADPATFLAPGCRPPGPAKGYDGPIRNSAGDILVPAAEIELCSMVVRITKNLNSYPTAEAQKYMNKVNNDTFTINKRSLGFVFTAKPFTCRMKNISGKLEYYNDIAFFPTTYELEFRTGDPLGSNFNQLGAQPVDNWHIFEADRGWNKALHAGDPDGNGGTISNSDLLPGMPQIKPITDADGDPLSEPQLLNGSGALLNPNPDDNNPPVYLEWQGYRELPFAKLKI